MPRIYDNIENHLTKGLNDTLEVSLRTDFCVGYFNLRGWKEVADKIDALNGEVIREGQNEINRVCRLLVGMQKLPIDILKDYFNKDEDFIIDQAEAVKLKKKLAIEFKEQLTIGIPTEADERALRKLSQQMNDGKVVVKLHLRYPLHAKLYLAYSDDKRVPVVGFLGSSNLTLAGLAKQGELNIDVLDHDAANKLAKWFTDRWMDRWCIDITQELIEIIDTSWASQILGEPYHIYLKIAYHLSLEARNGISEYSIPLIFTTGKERLLPFQEEAVRIAAKKLNKRDGVMVGDVVGLGKTITACAIAKLFEENYHYNTLIICPKNLEDMWKHYVLTYKLRAEIITLSTVVTKLPKLRQYTFRQVIIDESHNLRNDQGNRYKAIKEFLDNNDGKVILLSATPYNKTYLDLSNQLRLFLSEDKDLGICPEVYIQSIGGATQYAVKHSSFIRSIAAFENSEYPDDWRELMRLYLIRRTRSFIKNKYAELDPSNGRRFLTFADGTRSYFPERVPQKVLYQFNPKDANDIYANLYSDNVVRIINSLQLPRYGLQKYITDTPSIKPTKQEEALMANLSRAGKRLMGFCRTNLFKRLESSGYSFLLSLSRHVLRNYVFVYAMQNVLPIPIGKNITQNLDDYLEDTDLEIDNRQDDEFDDDKNKIIIKLMLSEEKYLDKATELYNLFTTDKYKKRFDWIDSQFFVDSKKKITEKDGTSKIVDVSLIKDLLRDSLEIIEVLKIGEKWNPTEDRKLNALYQLVSEKHKNEKVLVFTQFADTAYYLENELNKKRGLKSVESVTGDDENPTIKAHRFSPISNKKTELVKGDKEIRVLITTDVLSEGQNLQDAHIILNYDLPWAIIRLIQRAGRVDRIGQKAEQINCYSFLPEDGLEAIINLRRKLTQRIEENANVVGSDETFFDGDPVNLADLYNEKAGILDGEDDDSEVDLASLAYQIWKDATELNPDLKHIIQNLPNVVYATKQRQQGQTKDGVIVYTRTADENDVLVWVDNQGKIVTQSQFTILKAAQCSPDTVPKEKLPNHHELVKIGVDYIKEEEKNSSGTLGKKNGAKYRTYMILKAYCDLNEGTLFVTDDLKKAVDDIYKYTLKEFARETLNRQLKAGISDDQLASLVISLREEDKLCIVNEDDQQFKLPQIICSMGLSN